MFDELKDALVFCSDRQECADCPYFARDGICYETLHREALAAITKLEKTVAYLLLANNQLRIELQNSIDLKNYCMKEGPGK